MSENGTTKSSSDFWNSVAVVAVVIGSVWVLLMPTPAGMPVVAQRVLAITILMAGLWMTQAVSLAATSLLPLVLYPIFGIQTAKVVSKAYINDNVFLYLGGFIIALGIERWGLHRRIALNIVRVVGVSPKRLVLGFLLATALLSMWISNTASALLMLPIALALLKTLDDEQLCDAGETRSVDLLSSKLAVPLLLAIAYAASIGGLTTIIGTPTNNAAVAIYREKFVTDVTETDSVVSEATAGDQTVAATNIDISVGSWMLACLPIGILYIAVTWYVLTRKLPRQTSHDASLRLELRKRLNGLGKPSPAEIQMMIVFGLTAALWVFRNPLSKWLTSSYPDSVDLTTAVSFINDSTISIGMAFLLFCLPSGTRDTSGKSVPLMNWETASKLPWDIMLLFGGGFALAGAFDTSGLSEWLGDALQGPLQGKPLWMVIAAMCLLMTFLTEFTSNVATVTTLLPTLCALCVKLEVDPRMLIIPATLATSCAFMLPIATPPNAIVFASGRIKISEMVRYGLLLNLIGVPILTAGTYLLIKPLMQIP